MFYETIPIRTNDDRRLTLTHYMAIFKGSHVSNQDRWPSSNHGVQRRMISVDNFFVFFRLFCCAVAIILCDLVHDVETIFHLSYVLTESGNLF